MAPYGSWKSPITTDFLVSQGVSLDAPTVDGHDVYWAEGRPQEGGRQVIVRLTPDGRRVDVNPMPFNARTRAHEYGGGAYLAADGVVYFSNFEDQRLYRVTPGSEPQAVTAPGEVRFADFVLDSSRNRLIAVREDHGGGAPQAVSTLVAVSLDVEDHGTVLVAGNDFYAAPRLSPDGQKLCWLTWNHSNMPWDGTELYVAAIGGDGSIGAATLVAGGLEESVGLPVWAADGTLHFVSDRTGWWNLYAYDGQAVNPVLPAAAEFAGPAWVFGDSQYTHAMGGIVAIYERDGASHLTRIRAGKAEEITLPFSVLMGIAALGDDRVVMLAASGTERTQVVVVDAQGAFEVLTRSSEVDLDPAYLSRPHSISYPTGDGAAAYGFYYPPTNPDYEAPSGEKPPLLVFVHGGPTGATLPVLSMGLQFWTSRGFAVVDVNYRGSTGYGRAFRNELRGNWGVCDIEDAVAAARYLVQEGLADPERLAIRGGSAGGYTTLAAATFTDTFKAGASYFGISDLGALARDTHKFESHYLDRMVGAWPAEEETYRARSPLFHLDRLKTPLILLQGLDDRVVPPNQAELMVEALRERGIPVAYVAFAGEGHGFRQAANIKRATEAEYTFYSRILGFPPSESMEPLPIWNLD
jgi:dipeptidyl aminopeptidase/acylaminoacyl peptidase